MQWYEFGLIAWGSLQVIVFLVFLIYGILKIKASDKSFNEIKDLEKNHTLPSFNKSRFHTRIEEYQGFCKSLNLHLHFMFLCVSLGIAMLFAYLDWEMATYVWTTIAGAMTSGFLTESWYTRYYEPELLSKWLVETENLKKGIYTVCDEKTQLAIHNGHIVFENEHDGIEFTSVYSLVFVEVDGICNVFHVSMYTKNHGSHQIRDHALWPSYLVEYAFTFEFPPSMDSRCRALFCQNYSKNKYGIIPKNLIDKAYEKRRDKTEFDTHKMPA